MAKTKKAAVETAPEQLSEIDELKKELAHWEKYYADQNVPEGVKLPYQSTIDNIKMRIAVLEAE